MRIILVALLAFSSTLVDAQAPDVPAFEVATGRENTSTETRRRIEVLPGGHSSYQHDASRNPVHRVSDRGRELPPRESAGWRAGWMESARFDIIAKVEGTRGVEGDRNAR